ncbi:phage holin family protein [Lusitaniella coriacea LEGE 07157]|uniref:Phage holin family protein n=1 Tax=Lusitaniella coriacea LEGE 07157 TaxID=945747 RepID=A0A8J7DUY8_9CYAN|nr:phage holin family protein [Lusitaniella coriacea]MBE9115190.1 phage holin family protein [Lusitaniella coriacea LEGE 07157]
MLHFLIVCLVTAVSLIIISKLPLGIEVDDIWKAVVAGIVFGILNAFVKPILFWLTLPISVLTLGLFALFLNVIIFGLAAWLVTGFRLQWGIWSAILGAIVLSILNSILFHILSLVLPSAAVS